MEAWGEHDKPRLYFLWVVVVAKTLLTSPLSNMSSTITLPNVCLCGAPWLMRLNHLPNPRSYLQEKLSQFEKQGHAHTSSSSLMPSKVLKHTLPSPPPPSLPLSPHQPKSKPVPQLLVTRGQTVNVSNFSFFVDSEDVSEQSKPS